MVDLCCGKRTVRLGAFPISIDFREFADRAATDEVSDRAWTIHRHLPNRQIILGIDRLDYTKGIIERLGGLSQYSYSISGPSGVKWFLYRLVVPSRREIPEYGDLEN